MSILSDKHSQMIGTLNEHIQAIMNNKDLLIDRLQRPYVGKYIKMEAAYHKYVLVFFLLKAFFQRKTYVVEFNGF